MKAIYLQSMTDYILKEYNERMDTPYNDGALVESDAYKWVRYAKFLKQPLKLEMFVVCDEDGNVLGEPNYYSCFLDNSYLDKPQLINYENCQRYKNAKEKVLFEGFMNIETRKKGQIYFGLKQSHRTSNIDYIMNDAFGLFFYDASNEKSRLNTIEDLLDFHPLHLTPTAIKQIQP